jgi:choice-of-anchor C domain-containing protein
MTIRAHRWARPLSGALAAALAVVVAASPARASAADASAVIQIYPLASATVQPDPGQTTGGCTVSVVVETTAFFSEGVRVTDVSVEFDNGAVLGKHDQHRFDSKVDMDSFTFTWPLGGPIPAFIPGDYKATVKWQAHNGNGLSTAYATVVTKAMTIRLEPAVVKLGTETKCEMNKEVWKYATRALDLREHADQIREGCPKCASYLDSVAAGDDTMAELAADLAMDPPDPNFTTMPTAVAPATPDIQAGDGVSAAAASAFRDLNALQAEAFGQGRAAVSAIERAQGARAAGDSTWESRQSVAAAGFLTALATQLERMPTASEALASQLAASGIPNPTADQARAQAVAANARRNGPPPVLGFPNWYKDQAKLSDDQIEHIGVRQVLAARNFGNPITLRDALTDAGFKNSTRAAADALRANATALTAQPLLNYAGEQGSPSPAPTTSATPRATQTSLVNNGGFDSQAIPTGASYQTLTAGKETLNGWRLERGSVDVVGEGGGRAATGRQFVDLSGNNTSAGMGVIAQDIAVTPGHTYRLSFQLSGNPNGIPAVKALQVTFGDQQKTFTFDTKGHTNNDLGWTTQTMEFASCDKSTVTVRFASQTEGSRGPNIDDIVVTDVGGASCLPFPLWLIWLGVGLLLAAAAAVLYYRWRVAQRRRSVATTEQPPADAPGS